eukprot:9305848-Alexandrium_andersonii.AAC.1
MLVIHFCKSYFVIEQPQSSLLNSSEPIKSFLNYVGGTTTQLDHGAYDELDAPVKPLKLMSTCPFIDGMTAK